MRKMSRMTKSTSKAVVKRWDGGFSLVLPCIPVPASRPRVTKWGTYYGKTYKSYRELADKAIPSSPITLSGNLHVDVEFVCHRPKTTKRANPRGDIDNHLKAILDAITGTKSNPKGYWNDDDQIVEVHAVKRWSGPSEAACTIIKVQEI